MPKKRIIKSDDDTVLWQRVITEVKPLKSTIELAEFAAIFARSDHVARVGGKTVWPAAETASQTCTTAGFRTIIGTCQKSQSC